MGFNSFLNYIDPGTGSMLIAVIIGIATALIFAIRGFFIKFKFSLGSGKTCKNGMEKIPLVIFTDDKRYWNVFEPVCKALDKKGIKTEYWTMSEDDPFFQEKYENITGKYIGEGNMAFARLNNMSAEICLATTPGLETLQWKRSKNVDRYIHIPHSCDDLSMYRMFALDDYDAILASGEIQEQYVREMENIRKEKEKEVVIVGSPYLDTLKQKADKETEWFHREEPVILVAPTWGESSLLNKYGVSFVESLSKTGYKIIIRPHPQTVKYEGEMLEYVKKHFADCNNISWDFNSDNFNSLQNADVLISDFSNIIFDFIFIFNRPVIYADTSLNKAPYDAAWLNHDPVLIDMLPLMGKKLDKEDFENMKAVIDDTLISEECRKNWEDLKSRAWYAPGISAWNVADYLEKKIKEIEKENKEKIKKEKNKKKPKEKSQKRKENKEKEKKEEEKLKEEKLKEEGKKDVLFRPEN